MPSNVAVSVAMLLVLVVALLMVMGAFSADGRLTPAEDEEHGRGASAQGNAPDGCRTAVERRMAAEGDLLEARVEQAARRYALSPRETEVLAIWATGRSAAYVEKTLFISQSTVKTHLNHIYAKTGTANRAELLELLDGLEV